MARYASKAEQAALWATIDFLAGVRRVSDPEAIEEGQASDEILAAVSLRVDQSERGWRALEILAAACNGGRHECRCSYFDALGDEPAGLYFDLETSAPNDLAQAIKEAEEWWDG